MAKSSGYYSTVLRTSMDAFRADLMGSFAEFEREIMLEPRREGVARAGPKASTVGGCRRRTSLSSRPWRGPRKALERARRFQG
jgi:DNA invertase Pin-like site-specific DNA recombinase